MQITNDLSQRGLSSNRSSFAAGGQLPLETIMTWEVLPKNTTSTAQYAAVAVKTSCFLALVKMEQEAEAITVDRNIVSTWYLLRLFTWEAFSGWSSKSMRTGTRSRTAAKSVRTARKRTSKRAGDTRTRFGSEPVMIFCSSVRKNVLW